ncbi:MAG: bacteriochlorophyll 4-vinyl reductase [Pseudomonadota bacterium]|nr:bacteriochlorophyll 4-vinyl reductase [Pseudomonadota bacterium]
MASQLIVIPGGRTGHRIGPNAILDVADALRAEQGEQCAREVFASAGLERYLDEPPARMVDEHEVAELHRKLRMALGEWPAMDIERQAGIATAQHLLQRHIPSTYQWMLRRLPDRIAGRVLLSSIVQDSRSFAGSARVTASYTVPLRLSIENNPMCRDSHTDVPDCAYYAAALERLFRVLVASRARVSETECEARGDSACCFEIRLR